MSARWRSITGVIVMSALLALYLVFVGIRAIALLISGTPLAVVMGIALLVLPVIGVWALVREIVFGWQSTSIIDELDAQNLLPSDLGDAGPTGKADRAVAESAFNNYRVDAENNSASWQSWARLGIVYDACGDRKRARGAMREAISLRRGSTN